ncbi:uncharacterized protein LOC103578617 [Microplitis demolitor]|uniref:uncharacterized protein LOC103578617 n=1 Tax=Microplitis demolitor TaxID=69319 RepID=UPI0004CDB9C2|nr:uncharacterized protein LOC103578617 [Microplitis demolitor]
MMAFDILDRPGGTIIDKLEEISINVEKSHLAYLQTDESEKKIELRRKLEGFIKEYLHLVPHEKKYVFQQTAHILHQSAATLPDFSGYRACSAWIAISLYAANLLAQPWRKEYRTLRTYSGFYKHEIETNLIGAELMFELMGYKHTGVHERGVMALEGPIDPDRVSYVSRDAIVAFVECQIIKQIWENVSQSFTVSWLEVLEFREKHVGTPENAIRALNHRFWERVQQRRKLVNYDLHYAQPAIINNPISSAQYPLSNYRTDGVVGMPGAPGPGPILTMPRVPVVPITGATGYVPGIICPDNYQRYEDLRYFESDPLISNHFNQLYGVPPSAYPRAAPLIELDGMNYDKRTHRRSKSSATKVPQLEQVDNSDRNKSSAIKTSMSLDSATAADSWDFVYRSLDDLGYSKDVAERGDVLRKHTTRRTNSKIIDNQFADKYEDSRRRHGNTIIKNSKINGNGNLRYDKTQLIDLNPGYNYDSEGSDVMSNDIKLKDTKTSQIKNKRIIDMVKNMSIKPIDNHDDYVDLHHFNNEYEHQREQECDLEHDRHKIIREKCPDKWNCMTCTFLNPGNREICEMCGKSRRKGNEDKPLASGGKECPVCTLVNEKEAKACEVCHANLKDSPTYI